MNPQSSKRRDNRCHIWSVHGCVIRANPTESYFLWSRLSCTGKCPDDSVRLWREYDWQWGSCCVSRSRVSGIVVKTCVMLKSSLIASAVSWTPPHLIQTEKSRFVFYNREHLRANPINNALDFKHHNEKYNRECFCFQGWVNVKLKSLQLWSRRAPWISFHLVVFRSAERTEDNTLVWRGIQVWENNWLQGKTWRESDTWEIMQILSVFFYFKMSPDTETSFCVFLPLILSSDCSRQISSGHAVLVLIQTRQKRYQLHHCVYAVGVLNLVCGNLFILLQGFSERILTV